MDSSNIDEKPKGNSPNILAVSAIFIGITVAYLIAKYIQKV